MTDWYEWRMCPVCKSPTGAACYSLSGRIITVEGLSTPDRVATTLPTPHLSRKPRTVR